MWYNMNALYPLKEQQQEVYFMRKFNVEKFVGIAMLAAIVVVLQFVGNFIKFGNVSISLVLLPIVVGAVLYGPSAGAILGAVFGAVIIAGYISGNVDFLWLANPWATAIVCILKGASAGFVSGYVFKLFSKIKSKTGRVVGSYLASIACPVVNTGIFLIAMFTIFKPQLVEIAGGTGVVHFAFVVLAGLNFLIEVAVNVLLAPAIVGITNAIKGSRKR